VEWAEKSDNNNDAVSELINKSLRVAELILRDEKYKAKVGVECLGPRLCCAKGSM